MLNVLKTIVISMVISTLTTSQVFANEPSLAIEFSDSSVNLGLSDTELAALSQIEINTKTPWDSESHHFEGPSLLSVLAAVGAEPRDLTLVAANDYKIQIEGKYINESWPIIARLRDGETMSLRDKGPYWLMFPFDSSADLQNELFYSFSIWQLVKIIVE